MNDGDMMSLCWEFASRSADPSTQNGAILVPDSHIVTQHGKVEVDHAYDRRMFGACNEFPNGTHATPERLADREMKLSYTVHAELGAVLQAARCGCRTQGATLFALWAACPTCASSIVQAGVDRVVRHAWHTRNTPERWRDMVKRGDEILADGGVEVVDWSGGLSNLLRPIRFDGSNIDPSCLK